MKKYIHLIILIIVCLPIIQPIVAKGFFTMHDDTQVARVVVMGKALRNGQFPVRLVSDLGYGYGYPLYNFYGPLPYYIGGFIYAAGWNGLIATKVVMALGMIFSAITMYLLAALLFGSVSGLLAGVLYAYAPYHAVQLYVRGAVGELWAYALLPLFVSGIVMVNHDKRRVGVWVGGMGLAGVILSHTISGYVTVVFYVIGLALYSIILLFKKRFHVSRLTFLFSLLLVGLGLSAFFWLPAMAEMNYTNVAGQIGTTSDFHDHFVCLPQLWNSLWGYGGSVPGCLDGMSFKVGKLHAVLFVIGMLLGFFHLRWSMFRHPVGLFTLLGITGVLLVTQLSTPIWELIPGFAYIQYPWRFLGFIALASSMVGSSMLIWFRRRFFRMVIFVPVVVIVVFVSYAKLFVSQQTYEKPASFFEDQEELTWRVSRVSDEYLPPLFPKPENASGVARGILLSQTSPGMRVETEIDTETYAKLHVQAQAPIEVTLNRAYFPGWQYWVNGMQQTARITHGLPTIRVPMGKSVIELHFADTLVRSIGNIISLAVIVWFIRIYGKKTIT